MATTIVENEDGSIDLVTDGVTNRFSVKIDETVTNQATVAFTVERIGSGLSAQLQRAHIADSGQRVAIDTPGCSNTVCITVNGQDGQPATNG